jgi:hypothetical protein
VLSELGQLLVEVLGGEVEGHVGAGLLGPGEGGEGVGVGLGLKVVEGATNMLVYAHTYTHITYFMVMRRERTEPSPGRP